MLSVFILYFQLVGYDVVGFHFVLSAGEVWCCRFSFCTFSWWGMMLSVFILYFQPVGYGVVDFYFVLSAGGV